MQGLIGNAISDSVDVTLVKKKLIIRRDLPKVIENLCDCKTKNNDEIKTGRETYTCLDFFNILEYKNGSSYAIVVHRACRINGYIDFSKNGILILNEKEKNVIADGILCNTKATGKLRDAIYKEANKLTKLSLKEFKAYVNNLGKLRRYKI